MILSRSLWGLCMRSACSSPKTAPRSMPMSTNTSESCSMRAPSCSGSSSWLKSSCSPWPSPTLPNPRRHTLWPAVGLAHAPRTPQCAPAVPMPPQHMPTHDNAPGTPTTPSRPPEQPQWSEHAGTGSGPGPDQYRQSMAVPVPVPKILSGTGLSSLRSGKNGLGPDQTELPQH